MKWFDYVRFFLLTGGGVGAFTFVIYYWITARWWREELGRFFMASGFGWVSLYSSGIINMLVTSEIVRDIIRSFLLVMAFLFVWYSVSVYHRSRKRALKEKKEEV